MPNDIEEKVKCPHGKPNMVEFGAFGYRCVPTGCNKPCSLAELPEDDEEDEGTNIPDLECRPKVDPTNPNATYIIGGCLKETEDNLREAIDMLRQIQYDVDFLLAFFPLKEGGK